jgi:SAM-dependent methyltransferase
MLPVQSSHLFGGHSRGSHWEGARRLWAVAVYSDYDRFAWFYDRYWGDHSLGFLLAVDRLLLSELPPGARIIDLACGTGQVANALSERRFEVTGVEASEEMLRFARERAPGCEFVLADARELDLPAGSHQAALSLYDSLNHLMEWDELSEVFRRVRAALVPGGGFLFDLNVEEGFVARWRGSFGIADQDHALVARSEYDPDARIGQLHLGCSGSKGQVAALGPHAGAAVLRRG